jgi:hypothetical protein
MRKQLLFVALILLGAIALDLTYTKIIETAGTVFVTPLSLNLLRWRLVILIPVYTLILAASMRMLADKESGAGLSWVLLLAGLAVGFLSAFPPGMGSLPQSLYTGMETLAVSPLGLTLHASAVLAATGLMRLLRRPG